MNLMDELTPYVKCKKVVFRYGSKPPVLDNVSLSLFPGHIYGLLGKNGVGKSTLFRAITGMNPIVSGEIQTLGHVPFERDPSMLSGIYLVPEEIEFPALSVAKYARLYGQFYPRFSFDDVKKYLDAFELSDDVVMKEMSQGQRKKAIISFALACHTDILLMDEPTNGLDITSKTQFRQILADFVAENRLVVISTHQVRDLEGLIDGVVIIDENHHLSMCALADAILDRMCFGEIKEEKKDVEIIYRQPGPHKSEYGIWKRGKNEKRQSVEDLDLELLFNSVMQDGEVMLSVLEGK